MGQVSEEETSKRKKKGKKGNCLSLFKEKQRGKKRGKKLITLMLKESREDG